MFIHFQDIELNDPAGWGGKRILTFDIDWAIDPVIHATLDIVEAADIPFTVFVTHSSEVLYRLRGNPKVELGIHPNFNPLFEERDFSRSPSEILDSLKQLVPEARLCRSHSLTTSGRFLELYREHGITHLSNVIMNGVPSIVPYAHINDLIEVPIYFADDGFLSCRDHSRGWQPTIEELCKFPSPTALQVFTFHPIHIALNNESLTRYEATRAYHRSWDQLRSHRYHREGGVYGAEDLLNCVMHVRE